MTPRTPVRNRTTYANVTATLALALAVGGGTAYAAGLVGSDDLARGAVTKPKIAKNAVTAKKVRNGTIRPADLADPGISDAVVRWAEIDLPVAAGSTGQTFAGIAACNPGEQALGGGFDTEPVTGVNNQPNVIATASRPVNADDEPPSAGESATGWYVSVRRNSGSAAAVVSVWVLCGS